MICFCCYMWKIEVKAQACSYGFSVWKWNVTINVDRALVQHRPPSMNSTQKWPGLKAFGSRHLPLAGPSQPYKHWDSVLYLSPNPYPNPESICALWCHVGFQGPNCQDFGSMPCCCLSAPRVYFASKSFFQRRGLGQKYWVLSLWLSASESARLWLKLVWLLKSSLVEKDMVKVLICLFFS